ncbi:pentatricopeptide repeat-containing protein At1g03540-like [Wolffia australiana]
MLIGRSGSFVVQPLLNFGVSTGSISFSTRSEILSLCSTGCPTQALRRLRSASPNDEVAFPLCYAALLQSLTKRSSFPPGLQLHAHILKSGLDADRFVGNSLLSLYFKLCPDLASTRRVFDEMPHRDVVAWTSMVSGYVRAGEPLQAVALTKEMWVVGVGPNAFTLSAAVKSCAAIHGRGGLLLGRSFHSVILSLGHESNPVISSSLIDMYGGHGSTFEARRVFEELPTPDAICWTAAISALARNEEFSEALAVFVTGRRRHRLPVDGFTCGSLLAALGNLGRLRQGKQAHSIAVASGLADNVVVGSSLVDMYAKCGTMAESRRVFDRIPAKNAVSWCALLGGYCHAGDYEAAVNVFRAMDKDDDNFSLSTVLRACAGLADARRGKELHGWFVRTGRRGDVVVGSALVDLYCKCGIVDYARRVFNEMPERNSITWNAMICGFAQNGRSCEAVDLFEEMAAASARPDYITFVGVLFACSHGGMVEEGQRQFRRMTAEFSVVPGVEHYSCMVDLLGRAGLLEEAEAMVDDSAFAAEPSLWAALLGACAAYSDAAAAERAAARMRQLDPRSHLSYVLLSNAYKAAHRWDDASELFKTMKLKGIRKTEGRSWI